MAPWHMHGLAGGPETVARAAPARPACLHQASSFACVHHGSGNARVVRRGWLSLLCSSYRTIGAER